MSGRGCDPFDRSERAARRQAGGSVDERGAKSRALAHSRREYVIQLEERERFAERPRRERG